MTDHHPLGGPVSEAIEAELRTWVRKHGVVLWLDADDHYAALVDRLAQARSDDRLPYDVFAFKGSYLELSLQLEPLAGGFPPKPMVVHLPRFNEQAVREGPLLELHLAGARFRKALDTAVSDAAAERVRPEAISAYTKTRPASLAEADAWLTGELTGSSAGLAAVLRPMNLNFILDDLLGDGAVAGQLHSEEAQRILWAELAAKSGMPDAWRDELFPDLTDSKASRFATAVASWALCVEFVRDLSGTRDPIDARLLGSKTLPSAVAQACCKLAPHLRSRHAVFYQRTADETEAVLDQDVARALAEDLGKIDTFRFEEKLVLDAALLALEDERWDAAAQYAHDRIEGRSFWLQQTPERKNAWLLVRQTAALGRAIAAAGPELDAEDLPQALRRYTTAGASVDQAHRHLEQRREDLLYPLLPEYETIRARLNAARGVWLRWADRWAADFNALCTREGFLPEPGLQQRTLFDDVVRPATQVTGITAYFMVDALRYEMAQELLRDMDSMPTATFKLDARLAELPTITAVGMNVLAPVATDGRLSPRLKGKKIEGFSTGEYLVKDPDSRRRAQHDRVGGSKCPCIKLDQIVSRDSISLRRAIGGAKLVVVHSEEIDAAGEKGQGPNAFGNVLLKLRAAWRLLHDAGVQRFVITADHGFLMLDDHGDHKQPHGANKTVPTRRYVLSETAANHTGEARVALADLQYEDDGARPVHLMVPQTTVVFDTGNRPMSFVHGGNSLQERVIPVLTVVHRAKAGATTIRYRVSAEARDGVAGMHCIVGQIEVVAQGSLDFGGSKEVELALRVVEPAQTSVELCQARLAGRLERGSLLATVGEPFELFFLLSGPAKSRAQIEIYHPSAAQAVDPITVSERFDINRVVARPAAVARQQAPSGEPSPSRDWLQQLPEGGVRELFEHLTTYGAVTESEAITMLGSARKLRRFSSRFDDYAKLAPFKARIVVVAGVKRYAKESSD